MFWSSDSTSNVVYHLTPVSLTDPLNKQKIICPFLLGCGSWANSKGFMMLYSASLNFSHAFKNASATTSSCLVSSQFANHTDLVLREKSGENAKKTPTQPNQPTTKKTTTQPNLQGKKERKK